MNLHAAAGVSASAPTGWRVGPTFAIGGPPSRDRPLPETLRDPTPDPQHRPAVPPAMTLDQQIDRLRERIAQAQSDRDELRKDGPEEQYLEAYVITKALEMELDELLCQPRR